MLLRLTNEELELMRTALLDSVRSIRNDERVHCGGASHAGIELCRKRLRLEALLDTVDEQRTAMAKAAPAGRVSAIAMRRPSPPYFYPDLAA